MNIKLFIETIKDFLDYMYPKDIYDENLEDENLEDENDEFINACSKFLSFIHSK
jgi:hypothetical protein